LATTHFQTLPHHCFASHHHNQHPSATAMATSPCKCPHGPSKGHSLLNAMHACHHCHIITVNLCITASTSPLPHHHHQLMWTHHYHCQQARNATSQPMTSAHHCQHPPMPCHSCPCHATISDNPRCHVSVDERTVPHQNGHPSPPQGMWAPKSTGGCKGEPEGRGIGE